MVGAHTISSGSWFQSVVVRGKKECLKVSVWVGKVLNPRLFEIWWLAIMFVAWNP